MLDPDDGGSEVYALARTKGLAAAIVVALAATVLARSPFQSSATKELTGSISGRVTIEGHPARGVAVLLLAGEDGQIVRSLARATTDQDGRYQMTGLPAGQHLLQAFAPALIAGPSYNSMGRSGQVINIGAGEALDDMDIALTRGAAITGRVIDAGGQPLIQEYVRLLAVDDQGRRVQISFPGNSLMYLTDDRGVYRLFGVPPRRYILCVGLNTSGGTTRGANSGNTFYPLTFHPGVIDEAKATVVEVAAGGEATGVDIVLGAASKAYSVSGRIVDAATGKPLSGLQYGYGLLDREERLSALSYANSTSGTRGEFRLDGVAPGRYSAFAVPLSESEGYSETAALTVSDSDVSGIEIKVHRGSSSISGTVVIEGAEDQRGAPHLSDLRLNVFSSGSINVVSVGRFVTVASDGSFSAAGLPPGIASLTLAMRPAPKGLSFIRVERDGVEQKNGIEVGVAEEISGVKVVFGYGTGSIRGLVQIEGGEMPTGAVIFLSVRQLDPRQPQQYMPLQPFRSPLMTPDSRGRFATDGLLPGEYELELTFQVRSVSGSPQMSPKFVKQTVTVTNGTETQITMVVDLNEKNQ
jgi:hypothetical protein